MLKREDAVPEMARASYNYLREHAAESGYGSMSADGLNNAYARIQKIIRYETNQIISKGLSVNEFGVRPIVSEAQNYLDNHYLKAVSEKESNGYSRTLMPQFYLNINEIYAALEKRESNNKTETVYTSIQPEHPKQPAPVNEVDIVAKKFGISREEVLEIKNEKINSKVSLGDIVEMRIVRSPDGKYNPTVVDKARAGYEAKVKGRFSYRPALARYESTQEKINSQQPVVTKPKRKDSDQNSR